MIPKRYIQAVISLLVVGAAYIGYARVVVPHIEPPIDLQESAIKLPEYESPSVRYRKLVKRHFPPNAWERGDDVTVILHGEFVLLLREHEFNDDGEIIIQPCTVVRMAKEPGDRNWVMQASDKAILRTEQTEEEQRRNSSGFGKIVSCFLPNHVVITGSASSPQADDDILIETRGIQVTEAAITTQQDIEFRLGKSHGSGRDLTIRLRPPSRGGVQQSPNLSTGLFRQIELVHLEEAVLYLPQKPKLGSTATPVVQPVHVKSDGPVLIDFEQGIARINRNVSVIRELNGQPADELTCNDIVAHFEYLPETLTGSSGGLSTSLPRMNLIGVEAEGLPARLSTATVSTKNGVPETRWHTIEAAKVVYSYDGPGELGQLQAMGAGRYASGTSVDHTQLEFSWQQRMEVTPQGTSVQLALVGSAACNIDKMGNVQSDTIWLQLTSDPAERSLRPGSTGNAMDDLRGLRPEHIVADRNVRVTAERLSAFTDRLDVYFRDGQLVPKTQNNGELILGAPTSRSGFPVSQNDGEESDSRFQVRGDRLEINVTRSGKEHQLRDVVMNGHVTCNEVKTDPARPTMELTGEYFKLSEIATSAGKATIRGAPAAIRAPGMNLYGGEINVSRDENRFWIDGPGSATAQLPAKIAQRYRSRQPVADLKWEGSMNFDGLTIQCRDRVNITGPAQRVLADAVSATLNERIDFATAESLDSDRIELDRIVAIGKVNVEHRSLDDAGWISVDRCQVRRLVVNHAKETVIGEGPGWIETVRRTEATASLVPGKTNSGVRGLTFMRVKFEHGFEGSLAKRQMTFRDRIEAIYGPVNGWNQRLEFGPVEQLVPESAILRCQNLVAYQLPQGGAKDQLEMIASGSATISGKAGTGQTFAARASRISYHQSKDLLMLTGDNRTEAELWYQDQVGGDASKASARQFLYWPKTNRIKVEGSNMLDFRVGG